MSSNPLVKLHNTDDGVARITLNRPEKLNAFMPEMIAELNRALDAAAADQTVNVIVLNGAGRAFCAGGDAEDIVGRHKESVHVRWSYYARDIHRIARTIERMDKPIIAALHGPARGAGLDLALLCDLRIAGESATFAESYVDLGLIAGAGGSYALPRLIGAARALELFWTGRVVKADEAERIGLVNRVVPDAQVLPVALEMATQIAAKPQLAVQMFRRTVYQGLTMSLTTHLDMLASHMAMLHGTETHIASVSARFSKLP